MTTEFNLSEKRKQTFKANAITEGYHYSYNEEDVKEFIRLLKGTLNSFQMHHWNDENEEHSDMPIHQSDFKYLKKEIDKLAGEKRK